MGFWVWDLDHDYYFGADDGDSGFDSAGSGEKPTMTNLCRYDFAFEDFLCARMAVRNSS